VGEIAIGKERQREGVTKRPKKKDMQREIERKKEREREIS
jgi:hypothetical protein